MLNKLQRAHGRAFISFKVRDDETVLDDLLQSGSAKVRFARRETGRLCEAVLINTSGGMTGGDAMDICVDWGRDCCSIVTSQAAERHYQSLGEVAKISTKLRLAAGACGFWLPQEAIMFDKARYQRETCVDLAGDARFIGVESSVFGRVAMDEVVERGALRESWRVSIDGKLVFADAFGLSGNIDQQLNLPSVTGGMRAISTIIIKAGNSEALVDAIRQIICARQSANQVMGGASMIGEILIVRLLATNSLLLRALVMDILETSLTCVSALDAGAGSLLPRLWRS